MRNKTMFVWLALALALLALVSPAAAAAGPLTGWPYDPLEITIPAGSVTEPLDNFPVMIKLDRDAGANGVDLRGVLAVLGSDANRKRIAVATADGTLCPVEIAEWSTADRLAVLWVKVPRIKPDQDTKLYLYYDPAHAEMTQYVGDTGEPAAQQVWSNGYAGVWLMKPNGGRVLDSTANGNHGTIYGATETDGPLGRCLSFDGVDDRVIIPHDPSLSTPTALTVDMLTQMTTPTGVGCAVLSKEGAFDRTEWMNYISSSGTSVDFYSYNSAGVSRGFIKYAQHAIYDGVWRYYAATTDVMETHTYLNGGSSTSREVANAPQEIGGAGSDIYIGYGWGNYAQCSVSFTTISSIVRSPAWIAAQNAVLHDTFVTYTYDPPPAAAFTTHVVWGYAPLTVRFTDTSTGNVTGWHWDFGDGTTSNDQNPTHTYTEPGTYTVSLTVSNAYGKDTETKTGLITVLTPPGGITPPDLENYDLRNGTYTQYWLDFSNGFSAYGLIYAVCLPFINIFGYWFFAMLWFLYLGISYMRTGDVTLPLTVGLISGAVWGAIMPPETFIVGYVMLATSIVAILMKLFLRDRL